VIPVGAVSGVRMHGCHMGAKWVHGCHVSLYDFSPPNLTV
jgi:hypothetical protein